MLTSTTPFEPTAVNANPFLATAPAGPPAAPSGSVDVVFEQAPDAGPSKQALLERAARLGPARPTLESILLPNDPVLGQKLEPRIAERRMRFTRIVKGTLGACVAVCVAALVATAVSGEASAASPGPRDKAAARASAPTTRLADVESLAGGVRAKVGTKGTAVTASAKAAAKPALVRSPKRH